MANRGLLQAAGSWSVDACCAVPGNDCHRDDGYCIDRASSSDWLFGLWPGPPQRFEPTGTDTYYYQWIVAGRWPGWSSRYTCRSSTSGASGASVGRRSTRFCF